MIKLLFSLTVLFSLYWTVFTLPTTNEKQVDSQDIGGGPGIGGPGGDGNPWNPWQPTYPPYPPGRPYWCSPCYPNGYCPPCYGSGSHHGPWKEKRNIDEVALYPISQEEKRSTDEIKFYPHGGWCPPCRHGYCPPCYEEKNNQKQD